MKKNPTNIVGVFLLLGIFLYSFFKSNNDLIELKKIGVLQKAIITGTTFSKGLLLTYSFIFENRPYTATKRESRLNSDEVKSLFVNKTFPLIISQKNPQVRDLLIFKEDFEKYNLVYPDSLKWVCDSLKLKDCN